MSAASNHREKTIQVNNSVGIASLLILFKAFLLAGTISWPAQAALAESGLASANEQKSESSAPGFKEVINDPLRVGHQAWETDGNGSIEGYAYRVRNANDVNRLILRFADIDSEPLIMQLTLPDDERLARFADSYEAPLVLAHTSTSHGSRHVFFLDASHPLVKLKELTIPPHIGLRTDERDTLGGIPAPVENNGDSDFEMQIKRYVRAHRLSQPVHFPLHVPTPEWLKADSPLWTRHYQGKFGLPQPYIDKHAGPIAPTVSGIDYWQANHFIVYREETADYLYTDYTALNVAYRQGTFPEYEAIVRTHTRDLTTRRDKALALLRRAMPELMRHPEMPPFGPACAPDRGLQDAALLISGRGWCNEQARVFVRLCQVADIPARLVFLWYRNLSGHVVTEFHCEDGWAMADASWFNAFATDDGQLLSAAQCHTTHLELANRIYQKRVAAVLSLPDEALVGGRFPDMTDHSERAELIRKTAQKTRDKFSKLTDPDELDNNFCHFGLLNYPLPPD